MIKDKKIRNKLEVLAFEEFAVDYEDFSKKLVKAFLRAEHENVIPDLMRCTKVAYEAIVSELEVFEKDKYYNMLKNYYYRIDPHYFEVNETVGSFYENTIVVVIEDDDNIFEGECGVLLNSYDIRKNKSYITIINLVDNNKGKKTNEKRD
jgi:hypothetical protein